MPQIRTPLIPFVIDADGSKSGVVPRVEVLDAGGEQDLSEEE